MKKKKPGRFRAVKQVKAMAREAIGTPPPTRRAPDTKRKVAARKKKHKPTLSRLLGESEA